MAEHSAQERTEHPTGKRLHQAREHGQVARSHELSSMLMITGMGVAIMVLGNGLVQGLMGTMKRMFSLFKYENISQLSLPEIFASAVGDSLMQMAPLFGVSLLLSIASPLAMGGWLYSTQAIGFNWDRLNPLTGFERVFSSKNLVEMAKSLVKLIMFCIAMGVVLWRYSGGMMALQFMDEHRGILEAVKLTSHSFFTMAAITVIVAFIDVPWQRFNYMRSLRMTKQEVRDEAKETEGSPEIKGKIRKMQLEVAARRMMEEVPKADVIVTNPTHYAVALRYDSKRSAAPIVVAKGADEVAIQIIRIGSHHKVMTFAAPPLARAIFHSTKVGAEIPAGLYIAVARVLAYVLQLRARPHSRDQVPPKDLPIPEEFRRD
jgi:flagellar biosynthetic protein FlhB